MFGSVWFSNGGVLPIFLEESTTVENLVVGWESMMHPICMETWLSIVVSIVYYAYVHVRGPK